MIAFSRGRNINDAQPRQRSAPDFDAFVTLLDADRARKKETAGYICGPLNGDGKRCAAGALPRRWLALDLDRVEADVLPRVRAWVARFSGVSWPTHSSTPDAPRERVLIELDREANREECLRAGDQLARDLADEFGDAVKLDSATHRGEQPVFLPPPGVTLERLHGMPLRVDDYATAPSDQQQVQQQQPGRAVPQGARNASLFKLACNLRRAGLGEPALFAALAAENSERCTPPLDQDELRSIARSATKASVMERTPEAIIADAARRIRPALVDGQVERGESALDLLGRQFEEPRHLCDPWIPEGLTITAGRPKLGKSTLARQKLYSVASGGELFGAKCERATALFLSLEEGPRQQRRKFGAFGDPAPLENVRMFYQWPRGAEGVEKLRAYLAAWPETRFVTIDSLTKFRDVPDNRTPAFSSDYEAVSALQAVCKDHPGVAVEVVHHTRKMRSDDPLDDISGTYGVSAAVDSYWVLRPASGGATLHVGGRWWDRDVSDYTLVKSVKSPSNWEMAGEVDDLNPARREILTRIIEMGTASPTRLGLALGISKQLAAWHLSALVSAGRLKKEDGVYVPL